MEIHWVVYAGAALGGWLLLSLLGQERHRQIRQFDALHPSKPPPSTTSDTTPAATPAMAKPSAAAVASAPQKPAP